MEIKSPEAALRRCQQVLDVVQSGAQAVGVLRASGIVSRADGIVDAFFVEVSLDEPPVPHIDQIADSSLPVLRERDPDARLQVMAEVYRDDLVFTDAEGSLRGHKAVSEKVQGLLDSAPGFVFTPVGQAHVLDDLIHAPWGFGPPDGEPVVRGVDMSLVVDGKIGRLYTVLFRAAEG